MKPDEIKAALLASYETDGGSTIWTASTCRPRNRSTRSPGTACTCSFPAISRRSRLAKKDVPELVDSAARPDSAAARGRDREEPAILPAIRTGAARPTAHRRDALGELPELRKAIRTDVAAAYRGDPAARSYRGDHPRLPLRPGDFAPALRARPLRARGAASAADAHRVCPRADRHRHPPGAQIGPHFFIDHGTGW